MAESKYLGSASVMVGSGLLLRLRGFSDVVVMSLSSFPRRLSLSTLAGLEILMLGSVGGVGAGVGLLLLFLSATLLLPTNLPVYLTQAQSLDCPTNYPKFYPT